MPYVKDPNSDDVIWVDEPTPTPTAPFVIPSSIYGDEPPTNPNPNNNDNTNGSGNDNTNTNTNTGPKIGDRREVPPGDRYFEQWDGTKWVRYDLPGSGRPGGEKGTGGDTGYPDWQMASYGGGGGGGPYNFPMLSLPDLPDLPTLERYEDFVPETWKSPNPNDIYNDASYQFRFNEGMRPIETSRAAQGLTRTGATLKALSRYGQNFASNEYDRIYNRAADSYDRTNNSKYQAWVGNRQNRLDAYDRSRSNVLDTYDRTVNKARDEFAPRMKWAELQYNRDWDVYKYQQDDEYRKWAKKGDWANQQATNYRPE